MILTTVPIQEKSFQLVQRQLRRSLEGVDAYEIWLDALSKKDQTPERIFGYCSNWKSLTKAKLVLVCKDVRESGKYVGTQHDKAVLLLAAAEAGVDFVDIGLHAGPKSIKTLVRGRGKARLILSWHDFKGTPSSAVLKAKVEQMVILGADVVKVATTVNSSKDLERLVQLALRMKQRRQPHIVLGMGPLGILTRIFADWLGNELNFVSLNAQTAPGQLSLAEMKNFQTLFSLRP
ncbi:MAG: type I 3-dehydroquinate dehydratase [bacterium]|nr:type I 3-dehydroquinate dehydratase [bacterium]